MLCHGRICEYTSPADVQLSAKLYKPDDDEDPATPQLILYDASFDTVSSRLDRRSCCSICAMSFPHRGKCLLKVCMEIAPNSLDPKTRSAIRWIMVGSELMTGFSRHDAPYASWTRSLPSCMHACDPPALVHAYVQAEVEQGVLAAALQHRVRELSQILQDAMATKSPGWHVGGGKASHRQRTHKAKDSPVDERTITKETRTHARVRRYYVGAGPAASARNVQYSPNARNISYVILPDVVSDAGVTSA